MAKITEKVLLEKCSPKSSKLEHIKTLDLSKMSLKLEDLPVELLSRLVSMESCDLSGNSLVEFPRALSLPALTHLNLSDNQMENVTTLEPLRGLQELKMEDNLYITVSDNYKLMVLLPKLRMFNGKDVSTTANHLRFVYSENLRSRIIAVWEKSFRLPDPQSKDKMAALQNQFVSAARQQVKYGPNSVSDFTKWRVEIMAKEYLNSLINPKEESENNKSTESNEEEEKEEEEEEEEKISSPSKRKQPVCVLDSNIRLTPLKKFRGDFPSSPVPVSPRKSPGVNPKIQSLSGASGVRMSPRKKEPTRSIPSTPPTPSRAEGKAQTPNKRPRGRPAKEEKGARLKQEEGVKTMPIIQRCSSKTQTPVVLKPLHVLQCHSKQDSEEDFSTQLWACAFQPLPDSNAAGAVSRLVATCGGDSLCVIDCETGMVMKKYKVPGEEFFSLAWSTVLMSRGGGASAQHCSVLAAGGKRGNVKLLHPRNNISYGEFRASRKALSVLRFNHQQGNFLFTGSYDNKIVMWDIGGVDSHYNYKVVQLLVLEVSATPLHICLPPKAPGTQLLTGCEDGLHCYNTQLGTNTSTKRSEEMEITFPIYKKEDKEHDYHTIDGLSFLTDDIVASKNYSYGCIYLWSWLKTRSQRPDKKSREVSAVLLCELQWADTEIPYLALNTCPGRGYIVCGDDRGRLWTYHVTDLQKSSFHNGKPIVPTQVLEWPCPVRKGEQVSGPSINSVAMDTELQYLVALSDKNMVIVWKREEKC